MLKGILYNILCNYRDKPSSVAGDITVNGPKILREKAHIPNNFKVYGGYGKGNRAEVPWFGILDKEITTTAQSGYYIVYIFNVKGKGVYLSLNQGWTAYRDKFGTKIGKEKIKKTALYCRELIRSPLLDFSEFDIQLDGRTDSAKAYERGNICAKFYPKEHIPNDEVLVNDLRNLMGIYAELKGIILEYNKSITNLLDIEENIEDLSKLPEKKVIQIEEEKAEKEAKKKSLEELLKKVYDVQTKPPIEVKTKHYPRNPYVNAYVKKRANGICELCEKEAPFISKDGEPFLECHHIEERAENGPDTINNCVALCPNCHRKMHILKKSNDVEKLKAKAN